LKSDQFFDVVYVATKYRAPGTSIWYPTTGLYQLQFLQDLKNTNPGGTFAMHYTSYLESNLCPYGLNCVCSGGITGTFSDGTPIAKTNSGGNYDPNTPYVPDGTSPSNTGTPPTDPNVSQIYVFDFALNIQVSNLTSGCANGHKFNQPILMYRFSNGDLIAINDTSELYMTPQTATTK
jgi:hypothetical protein